MGNPLTRRQWVWLAWLMPLALCAGGGSWLLGTQSGLVWVASVAQRYSGGALRLEGEQGSLLQGFTLAHLRLRGSGWQAHLQTVDMRWQPGLLLRGELNVLHLHIGKLQVTTEATASPATAPVLPDELRLPFTVQLTQIDIGELQVMDSESETPAVQVAALRARFRADAQGYALQLAHAQTSQGTLVGTLTLAPVAPFALLGDFTFATQRPLAVDLHAQVTGDLQQLRVSVAGAGGGLHLQGDARLSPLALMPLADLQLDFSGLDTQWLEADAPPARVSGRIELQGTPQGGLEGKLRLDNPQAAPLDRNGLPLRSLQARVRWSERYWQLYELVARLGADGHIAGEMDWRPEKSQGALRLQVAGLDPQAIDTRAPRLHLDGEIALGSTGSEQLAQVALTDEDIRFSSGLYRRGTRVTLHEFRLLRGETELAGEGELNLDRQRSFHLDSHLQRLDLQHYLDTAPTDLNAALSASGTLLPQPDVDVAFQLEHSRFAQHQIGGQGTLHFHGSQRAAGDVDLQLGDNALNVQLAYGGADDFFRFKLDAPHLEQLGRGLQGHVAGQAEVRGSLAEPAVAFALGAGDIVLPGGARLRKVEAAGRYDAQQLSLQLAAEDVRESGGLVLPTLKLDAQGTREQHVVQGEASLMRDQQSLGQLSFAAAGGLQETEGLWQWGGQLNRLQVAGILPLTLQAPASLRIAPQDIALGEARLVLGGGQVTLRDTRWQPGGWHSAGSFSGLGVRAIDVAQDAPATTAAETLRFGGEWELAADTHWRGHVQVQRETGDLLVDAKSGQQLGLSELAAALDIAQDQLAVRLAAAGTRLGRLEARARVPLTAQGTGWTVAGDAPLAGHIKLDTEDLAWLGPVLHDNLQSGGRLVLDADLRGTFHVPRLQGAAQGDGLHLALIDQGVNLDQGTLRARFDTDIVHVDQLSFVAPYLPPPEDKLLRDYRLPGQAGQLHASGRIDLADGGGVLTVQAAALPLVQRADRWLLLSGQAEAVYADRTVQLRGAMRADAGLVAQIESGKPRWSDDVKIVGTQQAQDSSGLDYTLDASLDLGDQFYLRALGLESRLSGKLELKRSQEQPLQATGIIATESAIFEAYGQRLTVDRGMVNFQGPPEDPGLNILATRKGLSVEAGVEVSGTARHPVIRLVSTPEVPDAEKLSWIVLGRVPESGSVDSSLLLAAAGNLLGGQSVGQIGRSIGVDELSLHQREIGDPLQNQVVTVGKRLSSRAYLSYEQGLSDVGGLTKFTYTLTPRITLVTRTGTEDAVDLLYSFRFY